MKRSGMPKNISRRESEVLMLLANEYTTKEIALALSISHHTVISHRRSLLSKFSARNVAGLIRRGFETKMLN